MGMRQAMIFTHVLDLGHPAHSPIDALDPKEKAPGVRQNCFARYGREVLAGETREVALGKVVVAGQGEAYGELCGTGGLVGGGRRRHARRTREWT